MFCGRTVRPVLQCNYAAPDSVGGTANDTLGVMISAPSPMLASLFPLFDEIVFEAYAWRPRTEPPNDT